MKHTDRRRGTDAQGDLKLMAEAHVVDPKRSAMMARIGQRNTVPEVTVRRSLHRLGYRFRLHRRDLPGTPDIVLPRHRVAVLVHGCFWHRHQNCRFAYTPKTRVEFWTRKFEKNVERDQRTERALQDRGWAVVTIWECETSDAAGLDARLRKVLRRVRKPQ
jgi:DNA mismatch endonuclease, patch repair protein